MTPKVEIVMENVVKFDRIIMKAKKSSLTASDDAVFNMESLRYEVIMTCFGLIEFLKNLKIEGYTASFWQ